jgi:hypothetical protein
MVVTMGNDAQKSCRQIFIVMVGGYDISDSQSAIVALNHKPSDDELGKILGELGYDGQWVFEHGEWRLGWRVAWIEAVTLR